MSLRGPLMCPTNQWHLIHAIDKRIRGRKVYEWNFILFHEAISKLLMINSFYNSQDMERCKRNILKKQVSKFESCFSD